MHKRNSKGKPKWFQMLTRVTLPAVSGARALCQASGTFAATLLQINCFWMIHRIPSHYQMPRKEMKQRKIVQSLRKSFLIVKTIKMCGYISFQGTDGCPSLRLYKIGFDQLLKRMEGRIHYWQGSELDDTRGLFPLSYSVVFDVFT